MRVQSCRPCRRSFLLSDLGAFGYHSFVKHPVLLALAFLLSGGICSAAERTMRLDFFHTGNAAQELFSVDRISIEPLPWPGSPKSMIDETNLGKYLFEVRDRASNRLLFSQGFSSIYGEWETTGEAKQANRTFHESLRFPAPAQPAQIILKKRDAMNLFREVWTTLVDPEDIYIDRSTHAAPAPLIEIQKSGDPAAKVDFLILGDGYTAEESGKFEKDARRLVERLFESEPFKSRRKDFNVWAICPPAREIGVSRPSAGIHRDSPLGTAYDIFGSERYLLTYDNRAFREIAQHSPYEFVEIITNTRTYGGGGVFNLYGTVAADSAQAPYVFVHEFGHHFADLADEYYISPVAYTTPTITVEPWEPNVTALLKGKGPKWEVSPGIDLPSPWNKEEYERFAREYQKKREQLRAENRPETEMEALFAELKRLENEHFAREKLKGKVGAFEGAMYQGKGYYRPELDCIMFTRSPEFCVVCRAAISRIIDRYARP